MAVLREVRSRWSAEARVLLRPASTYRELAHAESGRGLLIFCRKPLLFAFVLGCAVSALASGRFSVRLIADGAVSFAFVPVFELAAFALVYWIGLRRQQAARRVPFARAVDLFFTGNAPWLLWSVLIAAVSSTVPPRQFGPWIMPLAASLAWPIVWAAHLDVHFFREVMGRSLRAAVTDAMWYRAIAWSAMTIYFLGIAIWSEFVPQVAAWMGR